MYSVILEEAHVSVIMMYNWCSFLLKWLNKNYMYIHVLHAHTQNCNHTKEYAYITVQYDIYCTCTHINKCT